MANSRTMPHVRLWMRRLVESSRAFVADDCMLLAAGLAYYAFLSVFPLCLLSISILGYLWTGPEAVRITINLAADFLPPSGLAVVRDTITTIASDRGRLGLVGLVALIWAGRFLFEALEISVNRLFQVRQRRSAMRRTAVSFGFIAGAAALVVAEVAISAFLGWARTMATSIHVRWHPPWQVANLPLWEVLHSWILIPVTIFAITSLLYLRLPGTKLDWSSTVPGAVFCTVAWKVASVLYFSYLVTLAQSNPIYGSIWSVVGLLIWFFLCSAVFLFGAQLIRSGLDHAAGPPPPLA